MARLNVTKPDAAPKPPKAQFRSAQMGPAYDAQQAEGRAASTASAQEQQSAALQQQAAAPPAAMGAQPDEALLQQAMDGMRPSAPRPVAIAGEEANALLRARAQIAQQQQAQMEAEAAAQANVAANAAANEDDLLRLGRIVGAMSEQRVIPPGHATR